MRKVYLFNLTTLDGSFADGNDEIDRHVVEEEFHKFAIEQLSTVDTILFGRATDQMMAAYRPTEAVVKRDPIIARAMNRTLKIVFSRSLSRAAATPISKASAAGFICNS
jgi:hypothetical protein